MLLLSQRSSSCLYRKILPEERIRENGNISQKEDYVGLGEIEIIEDSAEKTIILVNRFCSGPLDAGIIASTWEMATEKRHKFRWSESKDVLMVELTEDEVDIPSPQEMKKSWNAIDGIAENSSIVKWSDIRELESGGWEIDGERKIMIHRDLILRFEEFTIAQIASLRDSREEDYIWEDVEKGLFGGRPLQIHVGNYFQTVRST